MDRKKALELIDSSLGDGVLTGVRTARNRVRILVPEKDHRGRQSIRDITKLCACAFDLRLNEANTHLIINCGYDPTEYVADCISASRKSGYPTNCWSSSDVSDRVPRQTI